MLDAIGGVQKVPKVEKAVMPENLVQAGNKLLEIQEFPVGAKVLSKDEYWQGVKSTKIEFTFEGYDVLIECKYWHDYDPTEMAKSVDFKIDGVKYTASNKRAVTLNLLKIAMPVVLKNYSEAKLNKEMAGALNVELSQVKGLEEEYDDATAKYYDKFSLLQQNDIYIKDHLKTLAERVADNEILSEEVTNSMLATFLMEASARKNGVITKALIDTSEFIPRELKDKIQYPKSAEEPARDLILKALNAERVGTAEVQNGSNLRHFTYY